MDNYPCWVRQNPKKYADRLRYEGRELYEKFPHIRIYLDGSTLRLEGPVVTLNKNQYVLRIVYPDNYPSTKPDSYVRDQDVIDFCKRSGNQGHTYHNYGVTPGQGLKLCLMDPNDRVNKGWTPNQTGITILEYSIMWLHAYEFKRAHGYWPLPE